MDEALVRRAVVEAVHETLATLGFDLEHPNTMQADLAHLHRWRVTMDTLQRQTISVAVGTFILGMMTALWFGIQALLQVKPH